MNNIEIEKVLSIDAHIKNKFLGVRAKDELNFKLKKNESVIINTCQRNQANRICHWISLINTANCIFLFDSLALSYLNDNKIKIFLLKHNKKIVENKFKVQSDLSVKCGQFSIVFIQLYYRFKNVDFIKKIFHTKNIVKNDKIVEKILRNLLRENLNKLIEN